MGVLSCRWARVWFRLDALAAARAGNALLLATVLLGFDLQGWIALLAGALLALITLFTGYSHVDFLWGATLPLNQQIGVSLLLASLATLAVDAQLGSRRRSRDQIDRAEEADAVARERDLADRERERAARRAQRQAACNLVQLRHQLEPSAPNARRIRDVISLLEEYGGFA